MKKVVVGLVAVAAAIALRPAVRRMGREMRAHCAQMAAQFGVRGEVVQQ